MTDSLFFDSDCISAFLWVDKQNILAELYPNRIIIPKASYDELSYPGIKHLKQRIDLLIQSKHASIKTIEVGTDEYNMYYNLMYNPDGNHKTIGSGEAASIVLAKSNNGILASNNLRDISAYIKEFELKHLTTGDILIEALEAGVITEDIGNSIWKTMLSKKRKLGANSFTEYKDYKYKNNYY